MIRWVVLLLLLFLAKACVGLLCMVPYFNLFERFFFAQYCIISVFSLIYSCYCRVCIMSTYLQMTDEQRHIHQRLDIGKSDEV